MTNKFDSDFDRIERAFRKQREMRARAEAKESALAAARDAFEMEKSSQADQGFEASARPNQQAGGKRTLFDWRPMMNTLNNKLTYSLMGSASVAVLAMFMVTPELLREQEFGNRQPVPTTVQEQGTGQEVRRRQEQTDDAATKTDATVQVSPSVVLGKEEAVTLPAPVPSFTQQHSLNGASIKSKQYSGRVADGMAQQDNFSRIAPLPEPVAPTSSDFGKPSQGTFEQVEENRVKRVTEEPVSTFSIDVDTASYAFMRASLNQDVLPPAASIRVEELVNYFDYDYASPTDLSEPFRAHVEIMPTPWNEGTKLMSIGIKGYELAESQKPASNLVFLIDTSGSMNQPNKLPLLRSSFKLLLSTLKPDDTVSIVTYAGSAGTVLEPTLASERGAILAALDRLSSGGSTAGAEGIRQAYALAERNFDEDGVNRVILATDGDFNVGIDNPDRLKDYIARKRDTGIGLSVIGFGRDNYNDELMQKLAQNGNGNASFIDSRAEAQKVLVEEAGSILFTIAKDVKLQVEFNPSLVSEYRLIGYETRALNREDFNNDKVDAGDIGAGHTVTALYEITPAGSDAERVEPLRYGGSATVEEPAENVSGDEYGFLKIRYKLPDEDESRLITRAIKVADEVSSVKAATQNTRFAASVAAFGQMLKGGRHTGGFSHDGVIALARSAKGIDRFGYRAEFINLVRYAKSIENLR